MSLFYGKDPERFDSQSEKAVEPKKEEQNTFREKEKQEAGSRTSVFLAKDKQTEKEPGCCERCCSCCTCSSLKEYFKVTNKDVAKRIGSNLKFWSGGFFTPAEQDYDLYGPFWLYTTMIFVVGAVHNLLILKNKPDNFQYDYEVFGKSLTVFYGLGFLLSALLGLIFGCMLQSKTSQIVCLYGYSMTIYIICVLLCCINMTLLIWVFLLYAAVTKVIYILKNIFESLEVPASKKFVITMIVIIEAAVQLLIIKFIFIKTNNDGTVKAAFSHMEAHQAIGEGVHLRYFTPHH